MPREIGETPTWGSRDSLPAPLSLGRCSAPWADQPALIRKDDRLNAVTYAELGQDARYVGLDRRFSHSQHRGDFAVGHARRENWRNADICLAGIGLGSGWFEVAVAWRESEGEGNDAV
jgi:hypothetical protein